MDLNGDSHVDLVSGSFGGYPQWIACSEEGLGGPEFLRDKEDNLVLINKFWNRETEEWDQVDPDSEGHCTSVALVDWESDGDFDLVLGDYHSGELFLRVNEGTPTEPAFGTTNQPIKVGRIRAVVDGGVATPRIADWNGDGQFDIVVGGITGGVFLLQNSGSAGAPQFDEMKALIEPLPGKSGSKQPKRVDATSDWQPVAPGSSFHVEVVDYDRDGDLDLLVGARCKWQTAPQKVLTPELEQRLDEIEKESSEVMKEIRALRGMSDEEQAAKSKEKDRNLTGRYNKLGVERREIIDDRSEIGDFIWLFRQK